MSLDVFVVSAANVPKERFGLSDPYVQVEFQGLTKKTDVKKDEENPTWNQKLDFDLSGQALGPGDKLDVSLFDHEKVGRNKLLGLCSVPLGPLLKGSHSLDLVQKLSDKNQRPLPEVTVTLKLHYKPPGGDKIQKQTASTVSGAPGADETDDQIEDIEEEEEEEVEEVPGMPGVTRKKKKKHTRRKTRGKLSSKPQDFQVRVKIIEGRQIQGSNIKPVCRLTVYNQTKQTRIKKGTNSPFWNEVFFYNFHVSPAELFDEIINFQIYDSKKLRSDSLIGSFKMDVGMVYDEPQHAFQHKWLLLGDPDDPMAGAKGYLKVSATVLGPGDQAPDFKAAVQNEGEDIESNLLRPAGVTLRPATFALKLYRAEDVPRMDSDLMQGVKKFFGANTNKELVDPYAIFSFAGKEVQSKIVHHCEDPEWNEELRLGLRFPSMCERIKIQINDWDRLTEDDTIASHYIPLSIISSPGDTGFLPTFGPAYINFYGSPREFSELPDEYDDLNMGKGEGVAYRGRALVELNTIIGELPEIDVRDIHNDDVLRVQKFQRRRKYKLHAAFLSSTMISAIDAPVEFEVSMGNYGNKLDESVPPCSSTTQPTNAVFDGCYYYFLPWGETKPCTVIDCHWEDISFRLETVNLITKIVDRLEDNINRIKLAIKSKKEDPQVAQIVISTLDQLDQDLSKPLPQPIEGQHVTNDLDNLTMNYRNQEMAHMRDDVRRLHENATIETLEETLNEVEGFLSILKNLTTEPQNSMPDVIIWMISGNKRIAYYRIPANDVLFSADSDGCGKNCGKLQTITMKYPGKQAEKENKPEVPALLRAKIWLGLEKHEREWHNMQTEGELSVFAETYENQICILTRWTNKGPLGRPKWSDNTGKVKLTKEKFVPPPGWKWEADWYISPELSMLYDKDSGHKNFLEDVYEHELRVPGTDWHQFPTKPWSDVKGDELPPRDEIELPEGWKWDDAWQVDVSRAVDEDGWEYAIEATLGGYGSVMKNYHLCRRRRWVRPRSAVVTPKKKTEKEKLAKDASEGWEYAPLFNMKFHAKDRTMDLCRRRRWHRKMVAESPNASCFFQMQATDGKDSDDDDKYAAALTAPRMFLTYSTPHKYQLRAYIYQARDLVAGDDSGLSDPFVRVSFHTQSQQTEKLKKTLCPTWDQTLMFEEIEIHGDPNILAEQPPPIMMEIFDHDKIGSDEFLGRTSATPMVKLDPSNPENPRLAWYEIKTRKNEYGGEILAAFELFLLTGKDLPFHPPKTGDLFTVPTGIRPEVQRMRVEILMWGVRNMKKFQLANVTSPSIEFELGGTIEKSSVIKNTKRNPNFDDPIRTFITYLPKEELYSPPMNIKVRDHRQFGRHPAVGNCIIKSLEKFRVDLASLQDVAVLPIGDGVQGTVAPANGAGIDHVLDMPEEVEDTTTSKLKKKKSIVSEDIDWWSKYYASTGELDKCRHYLDKGYDTMQVYNTELEKSEPSFGEFADFCNTFSLMRGSSDEDESCVIGEFKGAFKVYPVPSDPNVALPPQILSPDSLPPSTPEACIVRVYVIKAIDLQPNDPSGLADPYVQVKIGKKKVDNRDDYIPNSLSPCFGRMFEIEATLPMDKDLYLKIKDYDLLSTDDTIGETMIDLESRYLTKYRATCGIPETYFIGGVFQWRDADTPTQMLEKYCVKNHIEGPQYYGDNGVKLGNRVFNLGDFEKEKPTLADIGPSKERLALHILRQLPIVKEHMETRPLYNPLQPGIEQGKVQMWVDIFPKSVGPPGPPVDTAPRKAKSYELRCIIWNTKDVIMDETSITGEEMSDIYVKSWISGIDDKQKTDVHYRSLDGEGNFNWRMVFPFDYLPAEQCIIHKSKEHFWSLDETELKIPPKFVVQVWDNDNFSPDDFLGTLEINLDNMPAPVKKSRQCKLTQLPDATNGKDVKMMSLFEAKRAFGYWPCYGTAEDGTKTLAGKVEMELEIVTKEDAELRPAGCGQEEPNQNPHLDPPKRPETSFLWFTSPFKTLKFIIWRNYKWYIIGLLVLLLLVLLVILFIYSFPGEAMGKIFKG